MILTVHINKEVPGVYLARACQGSVEVIAAESYDRIEAAIRGEANRAEGWAAFLNFTYGGMSTGTYPIQDVQSKAGELADRLVYLNALLHESDELSRYGGA